MPPFVPRKRARSPSPARPPPSKGKGPAKPATKRAKVSLFDAVDTPANPAKSLEESRQLLDELNEDEEDDSLSEADSDEFEDVPTAKRRKTSPGVEDAENEVDDDEMDWEDAIQPGPSTAAPSDEQEIADVSFSLKEDGSYVDPGVSIPGISKKGPSKKERFIRIQTHCLHVQSLMWHNTVRNSWLNDKEVQKTLVEGLTGLVKQEVTRWREAMGTLSKEELEAKKQAAASKNKGKRGRKGKQKSEGRDWSYEAEHQEQGNPNLSAGDPLLRLLKILTAYWRKRFTVTAPGLRKQGYMTLRRLRDEIKDWEKNKDDVEDHGERVATLEHFRQLAETCEGSRDIGAQLFAALLRGLGLETRLVANLQPTGFGWSKSEEADAKKSKRDRKKEIILSDNELEEIKPKKTASGKKATPKPRNEQLSRQASRGNKAEPITLDDSDSPLSSPPSGAEAVEEGDDDDISIVDVTPPTPERKPNKKYDRDLAFPNYWVEVCSPVSNKYIPVDPIVLSTIASNDDLLQTFEPRGKKAENAKQVMCYTIAHAADGTAKDVTVRYLKKHQLPGKTKGMRMPAEKVPIYNRKGKVKRYEEYDWFRTVMSHYDRPERKRTAADDLEDQTDLKPFKPAKEDKEVEKESLQWYKQSAEYVLEQHLRREEAIIPGAEPVRTFTAGKGDKAKEYPVYRRADAVACKTVESWHKEGRALKKGEHPMKLVPMRAVTLIRKREMEDAQRETGEKLKQALYSIDQTDWIIPPPIKDGIIPKNAFGNMDVYVPTMVPKGAVHLPLKGSAKLCRKLEIDYAEACTGFEFGKQRAVPVLTGVVVALEHEILVRDAWRADRQEQKRKEDTKRTGVALHWWRKMLLGLRVLERMRVEYADFGGNEEEVNPFVARARREGKVEKTKNLPHVTATGDDDVGGGFFLPGHEEEEVPQHRSVAKHGGEQDEEMDGGFLAEDLFEDDDVGDGGFLVEDEVDGGSKTHAPITPVSLQSLHKPEDEADDVALNDSDNDGISGQRKPVTIGQGSKSSKTKPRRKTAVSDDEDSESALSSVDELVGDNDSDVSDTRSDPDLTLRTTKQRHVSPMVVVPAIKSTTATKRPARNGQRPNKATPRKSQYFVHQEEATSDDGEQSTEAEVVKPRRTTARTKAKQ